MNQAKARSTAQRRGRTLKPGSPSIRRAYSAGDGVPRNDEEAVKWALRAAQRGSVRSYLFLGYAALRGTGTDKDLGEAYKWFNLAAAYTETIFAYEAAQERGAVAEQLIPGLSD